MAKPKSVTINLTAKQRAQLRNSFGVEHTEIKVEGAKTALSAKVAPRQVTSVGKGTGLAELSTPRKALFGKSTPRKALFGKSTPRKALFGKSTPRKVR